MQKLIARFVKDESGATAIEYGLIAALIAVAIITVRSACWATAARHDLYADHHRDSPAAN